jgi:hypothetical protein
VNDVLDLAHISTINVWQELIKEGCNGLFSELRNI